MIFRRRFKSRVIMLVCSGFIATLLLYTMIRTKNTNCIHASHSCLFSARREAIISILTGDTYLPGLLVLGYSLNKYNVTHHRDMIVFIPEGAIRDQRHLEMIQVIGWTVVYVRRIPFATKVELKLTDCLVKLYAWNMTQYDIIVVLDADTMIFNSIEWPFQQMRMNSTIQMLAVDDPGISMEYRKDLRFYFNSGVLFLRPNTDHFNDLVHLSSNKSFYDARFPQQNILNKYFRNQWNQLPQAFNMLANVNSRDRTRSKQTNNFHVAHFAGVRKPWDAPHGLRGKVVDADLIWRRFFFALVTEQDWQKKDFLGSGASKELKKKFRQDEWFRPPP